MIRAVRLWGYKGPFMSVEAATRRYPTLRLLSLRHHDLYWNKAEPGRAQCQQKHDPPAEDCCCGYYGIKEGKSFTATIQSTCKPLADRILGSVLLWGKVIEFEWGYRAEYARVDGLFGNYGIGLLCPKILQQQAQLYGVPLLTWEGRADAE